MRCLSARPVAALLLALLLAAAGVLAGCGRSSMVGRSVDDFSAYYNTFYNARQAFREATNPLDEFERPVDQSAYLPVFVEPGRVQNEEALSKAIEKSADLLRTHPGSKWVDDALLLIGKAYFYQENYVGAEQKFREVVERGGPLVEEARFWIGRALLSSGDWATAEQHLRRGLAADSLQGRWTAQMRLLQGDLRVRQGKVASAERALAEGIRGVRDGQVRARAFFLRGQALEAASRPGEAARSYRSAVEERAPYELAYAAEASALRTAARAGGEAGGDVLRRLRRMERDDKNETKLAELSLLRAQLYQAQGRPGEARRHYRALLYPGEEERPAGGAALSAGVRGRAHYALATLYRDAYRDFTHAAAHFDTASTALSRGSGGGRDGARETVAPPSAYAITDSRRQAERYGRVAEASAEVARLDSLLRLGQMDDDAFDAFVDSVSRARASAAQEAQAQQARRRAEQRFQRGGGRRPERNDGGVATLATGGEGSGFLFYRDPAQVQEGRRVFRRRWGERPRVPNWRRRAAISTQAETPAPGDPSGPVGPDADVVAEGRPRMDVSEVPRSPARLRQMRVERAAARYDLGNALLLAASRPDSAAYWFRRVIEERSARGSDAASDTALAQRARYALAEAERAAGRTEAARAQYRRVARQQPGTRLAQRAQRRLAEETTSSTASNAARVEKAYASAYQAWQRGAREAALGQMLEVAAAHPDAATAPRAMLAAARIFTEWARRTDHALTEPLPARPPDALGALLPDTSATPDSAASDSVVAPAGSSPPRPLTLERLLAGLAHHYPQTPHAHRARRMLSALREPTSGTSSAADSAGADSSEAGAAPAAPRRSEAKQPEAEQRGEGGSADGGDGSSKSSSSR